MNGPWIFGRQQEMAELEGWLKQGRSVLVHGPAGVGKTLLLTSIASGMPAVLYCRESATIHAVFCSLAAQLVDNRAAGSKSAVAVKGIVLERLRSGRYLIVMDHLRRPSTSFAAGVKEIVRWASTPVVAIARSAHMEECGFLLPLYPDRTDRFAISNFQGAEAEAFLADVIARTGVSAKNLDDFSRKLMRAARGNPGAILAMVAMAKQAKYRSGEHIKVTPLCIDFRMIAV